MKRVLQEIYGMARVGSLPSIKGQVLEIYVNTNDAGNTPHFHIRDIKRDNKFSTCVCIDKAEYFLHEGKEDTLNSAQRKALNDFMREPCSKPLYDAHGNHLNNWQRVCILWDENNSEQEIPEDTIQPDYTKLS